MATRHEVRDGVLAAHAVIARKRNTGLMVAGLAVLLIAGVATVFYLSNRSESRRRDNAREVQRLRDSQRDLFNPDGSRR